MKQTREAKAITRARSLGLVAFGFALIVSITIFLTEDRLDPVDYALIILAPLVFGGGAYFIGLYHDPSGRE